jgi:3-hydroxybutyryl-CoA dehydrogenase
MGEVKKSLKWLVGRGNGPQDWDATLERIAPTTKIEDLADCDVVIEAVLERFGLEKTVVSEFDAAYRADAILATNTSSISVNRIASTSKVRDAHRRAFLQFRADVEIIRTLQTTDVTCNTSAALTYAVVSAKENGRGCCLLSW